MYSRLCQTDAVTRYASTTPQQNLLPSAETVEDNDGNERSAVEEYTRIERVLGEIPYEQAETIRMHIIDRLKFTEIADITETPVTTVKSRFKYGIENIKKRINTRKNN